MRSLLSWTLNGALFAAGCLLAADTASLVIAATLLAPPSEPNVSHPSGPAARERSWADRKVILDRNLFASSTLEPAAPPVPVEKIEKSQLPMTLLGTFAANEPALSRATLQGRKSQETLVVGIGDSILDQALVVRIERRRVVLRENGALRELAIEEAEPGAPSVIRAARSEGPMRRTELEKTPEMPHAESLQVFGRLRGQMQRKFDGNRMIGLEVFEIREGGLFAEIGLEDGDVIASFNGIPIDSPSEGGAKLLQAISEADEYHLVGFGADGSEQAWDLVPEN